MEEVSLFETYQRLVPISSVSKKNVPNSVPCTGESLLTRLTESIAAINSMRRRVLLLVEDDSKL